ncbi:MAG: Ig-like domain-containing protein [Candidatus Competibacteraceae bacterium]
MTVFSKYFHGLIASSTIAIAMSTAWAGDIIFEVEEPSAGSIYTGVANVRGWAVSSVGIDRIELYVDGQFSSYLPLGGRRSDVGNAYPNFPDSANSGFSAIFNYSNLTASPHTFRVRVVDREGAVKESSVAFSVVKFDNSYIADPALFSLDGATGSFGGRSIAFKNVLADGKIYDIRLDWRTQIQGFAITQIVPAGSQPPADYSGTYRLSSSLTSNGCAFSISSTSVQETHNLSQSGSQLTGTLVENGQPLSGLLDSQGNFTYATTVPLETNPAPGCNVKLNTNYQGNFAAQTVRQTVNVDVTGNCSPVIDCIFIFQGMIVKTGAATAASEPAEAGGGLSEAILDSLRAIPFAQ